MAVFHFDLEDGGAVIRDPEGTELPDLDAARGHANEIARELMKNAGREKRSWKLAIRDRDDTSLFDLLFAAVDPTLDHLDPRLRRLIERISESEARLRATMLISDCLIRRKRAMDARLSGRPYLAARLGQRLDIPPTWHIK